MIQTQNITQVNPTLLTPHPKNKELFEDIKGEQWEEFKANIEEHGILNPIIVDMGNTIISGTQRWRAAIALRFETVNVIQRFYESEDDALLELIYCNTQQRFCANDNDMYQARRAKELQRILGRPQGRPSVNQKKGDNLSGLIMNDGKEFKKEMNHDEIASFMGINPRAFQRLVELTKLNPELQQALIDEKIGSSEVARMLSKLSSETQDEIVESVGIDNLADLKIDDLKSKIPEIKAMDEQIRAQEEKIKELEKAQSLAKGSVYKMSDLDNANAKIDELNQKIRDQYEQKESLAAEYKNKIAELKDAHKQENKIASYVAMLRSAQKTAETIERLDESTLDALQKDIDDTGALFDRLRERAS